MKNAFSIIFNRWRLPEEEIIFSVRQSTRKPHHLLLLPFRGSESATVRSWKRVFYGIEVKNKIPPPYFDKILDKKAVADFHGIQFVLATRNSERNGFRLFKKIGLHVNYGYYIWDPNFSRIAEKAKEKLRYPLKCVSSAPESLVEEIKKYLNGTKNTSRKKE